jgi:uncharacterized membrane protein
MPAKKNLRTAAKTVSWRVFAGVDSFVVFAGSAFLFGNGDIKTAATAALGAVGVEALSKLGWYFLHEKAWESEKINRWFN